MKREASPRAAHDAPTTARRAVPIVDPVECRRCGGAAPAVRGITVAAVVLAGYHLDGSGSPCPGRYRRARGAR